MKIKENLNPIARISTKKSSWNQNLTDQDTRRFWFLYRLALVYQNKAFKFLIKLVEKIEQMSQDILPNRLFFLEYQIISGIP
jgi:hypothetical protein